MYNHTTTPTTIVETPLDSRGQPVAIEHVIPTSTQSYLPLLIGKNQLLQYYRVCTEFRNYFHIPQSHERAPMRISFLMVLRGMHEHSFKCSCNYPQKSSYYACVYIYPHASLLQPQSIQLRMKLEVLQGSKVRSTLYQLA